MGALASLRMIQALMLERQVSAYAWRDANKIYALDQMLASVLSDLNQSVSAYWIHDASSLSLLPLDCTLSRFLIHHPNIIPWQVGRLPSGSFFRIWVVSWPDGACQDQASTAGAVTLILESHSPSGVVMRLTALAVGPPYRITYWSMVQ